MAARNMPAAEVAINESLVRALLADQHPDLVGLPIVEAANGWDNVIYRLGDDLCVRMPRREMAAALVESEQRWLPELALRLPIPIPAPVRVGRPALGYPWRWSVCRWLRGEMAADVPLDDPRREAERLGAFVAALHQPAPADAPDNVALRGHPLRELTERLETHLERGVVPDAGEIRRRWRELIAVDEWQHPPVWVHGDLHTANVLVADGAISAVIDFGDITAGDPAVDLAIAWMLFDPPERTVFRERARLQQAGGGRSSGDRAGSDRAGSGRSSGDRAGSDDALWARAEAWALYFAVIYLANSADNPLIERMGTELLAAVMRG